MNLVANFAVLASRRTILGLSVCDLNWSDALAFVNELASLPVGQTVISFLNANNANLMVKDPTYRDVLTRHLVLPDGIGVDIASVLMHGSSFPANLNGTDFVPALLTYMEGSKRIGLIGTRRDTLERAAVQFRKHTPWHEFVTISDGYFDKSRSETVMAEVERQKLDILIVAMGSPVQEKWVDQNIRSHHARVVITVGALLDFVAGDVPRAPTIVRDLRMEWLFRLMQEPRRLWKRYIVGIPVFMWYLARHRLSGPETIVRQADVRMPDIKPPEEKQPEISLRKATLP